MKRDDHGFSLIELIVVIAIMTILTVGIAIGFSALSSQRAQSAVKSIYSALTYTQTAAMAKEDAYLELFKKEDGYYYALVEESTTDQVRQEKKLCDLHAMIQYETDATTAAQDITETPLRIRFDHVTGAFLAIGQTADGDDIFCKKILVSKQDYQGSIALSPKTGHCEIE